jgi:hypothetical protein
MYKKAAGAAKKWEAEKSLKILVIPRDQRGRRGSTLPRSAPAKVK